MAENAADKNTENEAVEVTPEQLAASETFDAPAPDAPTPSRSSRRGLILGGSIAAGVLALALSFGGGYALGDSRDGDGPHHDDVASGQGFDHDGDHDGGRDGDRDGDRHQGGGARQPGMGGQLPQGQPGQMPEGQLPQGQMPQGQMPAPTPPAQSGTGTNGTTTTP